MSTQALVFAVIAIGFLATVLGTLILIVDLALDRRPLLDIYEHADRNARVPDGMPPYIGAA